MRLSSAPSATRRLASALILALALNLTAAVGVSPALAADPTPTVTATPSATPTATPESSPPIQVGLPDPKGWVGDVFQASLVGVFGSLAIPLHVTVQGVVDGSLNFVSSTPPAGSYANSLVQDLWNVVRLIANAALVLVVLGGGFGLIVSEQTNSPYHEAMELFPRLILGALLVNTSISWAQLAIDLNNALCQAIGGVRLPSWEQAGISSQALADVLAAIVYFVASLFLILQMLMRLALIDVLLVVSPLGLLCWVLPQTQSWAKLWSGTFFATVFTQFVQVLDLRLGSALLADSAVISGNSVLLRLLLGVAVIVLTLKLPGLMRLRLDSGLGFARYYAYRAGAQALSGGAAKVGAAIGGARAGGASRTGRGGAR